MVDFPVLALERYAVSAQTSDAILLPFAYQPELSIDEDMGLVTKEWDGKLRRKYASVIS